MSLVLGLASGCASTKTAPTPDSARAEVLDAEHGWWRAVSRGDIDRALSRFSEDTVFEAPDGSLARGRLALAQRLRHDGPHRIEVLGTPEHVHLDSPELVVVTGTGQWTETAPERTGVTTVRYIDTWRWNGSAWRLVSTAAAPVSDSSAGNALVRQVLSAWSSRDWAGLQLLLAPGYRTRGTIEGSDLRQRFETFHRLWSSARFDIEEQFAVGERIVTRLSATLTEVGTGRIVRYAGLDISRVVDGHLVDHWDSWEEVPGRPPPEKVPRELDGKSPERSDANGKTAEPRRAGAPPAAVARPET